MKVITIRSQIREVAGRWRATYGAGQYGADKVAILKKLEALDPENATAEEVADIIGNRSWAQPQPCDECKDAFGLVVQVGAEPDYESNTACLCVPCLEKAVKAGHEYAPGKAE